VVTAERVRRYRGTELEWEGPGPGVYFGAWQAREDSRGALWIGTMADGIWRLNPDGTWLHLTRADGLPSESVREVFEDREGTVWVGTDGGGPVSLRPRLFQVWGREQGLPESNVIGVSVDRRGRVFACLPHEGVAFVDGKTVRRFCPPGSTGPFRPTGVSITSAMCVDRSDRLWVAVSGDALATVHVFDGGAHRTFVRDQLRGESVNGFFEDSRGRMWVATNRGLACHDGRASRPTPCRTSPTTGCRASWRKTPGTGRSGSAARCRPASTGCATAGSRRRICRG
jgi:ligand-binding sensor domain-containing protein